MEQVWIGRIAGLMAPAAEAGGDSESGLRASGAAISENPGILYDLEAENPTAYGGLLPVATILEKQCFRQPVRETLTVKRKTKAITMYQSALAMMLACWVGFSRLYHLRFLDLDTGTPS